VILCRTEAETRQALEQLSKWVREAALTLHPTKTCVVNAVTEGFDFLGYRFVNNVRLVSKKSVQKLKDAIRTKTGRSRGDSMKAIIADVNKTLYGWFEYFKHRAFFSLVRTLATSFSIFRYSLSSSRGSPCVRFG
jgi:RNA-directed DNA polymerase